MHILCISSEFTDGVDIIMISRTVSQFWKAMPHCHYVLYKPYLLVSKTSLTERLQSESGNPIVGPSQWCYSEWQSVKINESRLSYSL